jgi:hypothetical protein
MLCVCAAVALRRQTQLTLHFVLCWLDCGEFLCSLSSRFPPGVAHGFVFVLHGLIGSWVCGSWVCVFLLVLASCMQFKSSHPCVDAYSNDAQFSLAAACCHVHTSDAAHTNPDHHSHCVRMLTRPLGTARHSTARTQSFGECGKLLTPRTRHSTHTVIWRVWKIAPVNLHNASAAMNHTDEKVATHAEFLDGEVCAPCCVCELIDESSPT